MFEAQYVGRNTGTSKKSGKSWYQLDLIAKTIFGKMKIFQTFCTANAYEAAEGLEAMTTVRVFCGVSDNGFITVNAVKYD